jgi:hypothetical protein
MLVKEIQHHLIAPLVLLLHALLLQIAPRRHPPMHLIWEKLDHIRRLDALLPLLDVLLGLVARGQHDVGDRDAGGVGAVDHSGVACCGGFEGGVFLGGEVHNLL